MIALPWAARVWRYVPRDAHPLHFGFILRASGRWNRQGVYGALYLATTQSGALAERAKYQAAAALHGFPFGPHDLVSIDVAVRRALDLTDPAAQRRYGVTTASLTADSPVAHALCHLVADLARADGNYVLFIPSAAVTGAVNVVIYPDVAPADCRVDVGPDRITLP